MPTPLEGVVTPLSLALRLAHVRGSSNGCHTSGRNHPRSRLAGHRHGPQLDQAARPVARHVRHSICTWFGSNLMPLPIGRIVTTIKVSITARLSRQRQRIPASRSRSRSCAPSCAAWLHISASGTASCAPTRPSCASSSPQVMPALDGHPGVSLDERRPDAGFLVPPRPVPLPVRLRCSGRGQPAGSILGQDHSAPAQPHRRPPARRPGWQSIPVPVVAGFLPGDPAGDPPGGARVQVALLEVNAAVAA